VAAAGQPIAKIRYRPAIRWTRSGRTRETGDEREVTVTAKVLERFEHAYGEYLSDIERFCSSKQVPYIQADVAVPFDELILRVFRRGGFLR